MKRRTGRFLSVLLTVCMLSSLMPTAFAAGADKFGDIPAKAWYHDDVNYVVDHGYFNGMSENAFSPDANMTRAMFVTVLARLDGASVGDNVSPFNDVAAGAWYAGEVKWASENGIVNGVGDNKFAPDHSVSRQEMAALMMRYIAYYTAKNKVTFKATGSSAAFTDADSVADYAKEAVTLCRSYGLINGNGDGTFGPTAFSTRAQVAAVIHRLALLLATGTPVTKPSAGGESGGTTSSDKTVSTAADFIQAAQASADSVTATISDKNDLTVNDNVTINASATTLTLNLGKASLGNLTVTAPNATKIDITGSGSVASLTINAPKATVNNGVKVNGSVNIQAVSGSTFNNTAAISGNILFTGPGALNDTQTNPAPVVVATSDAVAVRGNTSDIKVTADGAQLTVAPAINTVKPVIDSSADGVKVTVANNNPVTVSGQVATVEVTSNKPTLAVEAVVGTLTTTNATTLAVSGKGSVATMASNSAAVVVAAGSAVTINTVEMNGGSIEAPATATISTVAATGNVTLNAPVGTVSTTAGSMLTLGDTANVNTVVANGSLEVAGTGKISSIDVAAAGTTNITKAIGASVTVSTVTKTDANANVTASDVGVTEVKTKAATPTTVKFNAPTAAGGNGTITGVTAAMEYKSSTGDWKAIADTSVNDVAAGTYEVRVKATSTALASEAVTGTIPAAVAVAAATIQGTPYVGQTLTAVANADATGTLSYVWSVNDSDTPIGTSKTFTLTDAQIGKTISVTITNYVTRSTASTPTDTVTVDKTALNTLIAKAGEIQKGVTEKNDGITAAAVAKGIVFVTTSERTALADAVTAATTVANNAIANTQAVADAEAALRAANAAYVAAKKTGTDDSVVTLQAALKALVQSAGTAEVGTGTDAVSVQPGSDWVTGDVNSAYSAAIATAQGKESSNDAATLTAAITDLKAAMNTYIKAIQKGAALDRTALDAAVNAAEINAASVVISANGEDKLPSETWVTTAVLDTYNAAIKTAKDKTATVQNDYISALDTLAKATSTFNTAKASGTKDIVPPVVTIVSSKLEGGVVTIVFKSNEAGSYVYQIGETKGSWLSPVAPSLTKDTEATLTINDVTALYATVYMQVSDASDNKTVVSANVGAEASNAEAAVGTAKYDTLANAIAAAGNGQTVTLLKDVTETLTAPTVSSLTIDLGTHKLTMSNTASVVISGGKSLTIQNGSIESKGITDGTLSNFNIQTNSSITLENVIFDTTGSALYPSGDAASVTVTNSEIKCGVYAVATNAAKVENYNIVITLTGSTFTSTYGYNKDDASDKFDSSPVMINVPGTLNMFGCTVNGTRQGVLVRGGTATIQNSTINLTAQYAAGKDKYWSGTWGSGDEVPMAAVVVGNRSSAYQYPATCILENSVITATSGYKAVYIYGMDAATRLAKLNIKGNSTNITGEVLKEEAAANAAIVSITGGTFSDTGALKYLANGANVNVNLAADETGTVLVPANTTVTLDLKGHVLQSQMLANQPTAEDHTKATLVNNGNLTVNDSVSGGKVTNNNYWLDAFYNASGATAILNGGLFTHSANSQGQTWYAIHNHGTMTIKDGVIVADTNSATPICNGKSQHDTSSDAANASLIIDGGTFTAEGAHTIKNGDADAELVINGGNFTNTSGDVVLNRNNCNAIINGGTFSITDAPVIKCEVKDSQNASGAGLMVTNGSFTGTISKDESSKLSISGGTFSSNPTSYLANGYIMQPIADGYRVVKGQTT
ncbi:S-layer homology domain-containing protein [Acidaminobacterium chupaoyuni]